MTPTIRLLGGMHLQVTLIGTKPQKLLTLALLLDPSQPVTKPGRLPLWKADGIKIRLVPMVLLHWHYLSAAIMMTETRRIENDPEGCKNLKTNKGLPPPEMLVDRTQLRTVTHGGFNNINGSLKKGRLSSD